MADYYTTGQITLTNGSASIVGVGTAWQIANIAGGTIFAEAAGNPLPLETIADDTHATAAIKWTGPTGTYDYALLRATAFSEQLEANSNIMSRLLVGMEAGTIYRYDASGDLAEKATYDARPEDFGFLAIDVNPAQLFIKASAASGDWAGPFAYGTGPKGDQGPVGPAAVLNWRGAYSGATTYAKNDGVSASGRSFISLQNANTGHALPVAPATTNAWWDLTAEKGADGMGTGDVVGPSGGVATNDLAAFETATGKLIKKAPDGSVGNALLANMASGLLKGRAAAGSGAPQDLSVTQALDMVGSVATGDIMWRGASAWTRLAKGAGGQKLRMNAGATAPEWETGEEFIAIDIISSPVASLIRNNLGAFRVVKMRGFLTPGTTSVEAQLRTSNDNGSSFLATSGAYSWQFLYGTGNTAGASVNMSDTKVSLASGVFNGAAGRVVFDLTMDQFNQADYFDLFGPSSCRNNTPALVNANVFAQGGGNVARNAIQFLFSSGNIASGYVIWSGIRG